MLFDGLDFGLSSVRYLQLFDLLGFGLEAALEAFIVPAAFTAAAVFVTFMATTVFTHSNSPLF